MSELKLDRIENKANRTNMDVVGSKHHGVKLEHLIWYNSLQNCYQVVAENTCYRVPHKVKRRPGRYTGSWLNKSISKPCRYEGLPRMIEVISKRRENESQS